MIHLDRYWDLAVLIGVSEKFMIRMGRADRGGHETHNTVTPRGHLEDNAMSD